MGVVLRNEDSEFHELEDASFSDSYLVTQVRDALTSVSTGDCDKYNELLAIMHKNHKNRDEDGKPLADRVAILVTSLEALSQAVSCIDSVLHDSLLTSIFSMNIWNYRYFPDVMDALLGLVINLAASGGNYLDLCLEFLVGNFTPPTFVDILKQPRNIATKGQVLSRVHSSLEVLDKLVPRTPIQLSETVIRKKPHYYFAKEHILNMYVENMLKLESGAFGEIVGSTMLAGVVDLLLDLDVEIGWDDILQDDSTKGIFNMELEDVEEVTDDEWMDDGELPRELSRRGLVGNLFAEKLDSLMVITFEHLESCEANGRLVEVFKALNKSFHTTVLTAYKSKFSQFVMFYACSLDPENCGSTFAKDLANTFFKNVYPQLRMSAVAYLASYLSRGKFLSTSMIAEMLGSLVDWCSDYCKMQEGEINPEAHRIFYSCCQAIMYVLCFRMRSMMEDFRFKSQLKDKLNIILSHNLSPLKVCLPSIVMEFLRQAKAACLFTTDEKFNFDDYLESENSRAFGGVERLDMFFPFDPCLLRKSDSFIRPNYVYWSMVRPTYNDDESDEEIEAFLDSNGDTREHYKDLDLDLDEFDSALNKMSITPKTTLYQFGGALKEQPSYMPSRIRPSTSPESL
ncbi:hypothetical protein UlMin_038585 [Ulmus minor]